MSKIMRLAAVGTAAGVLVAGIALPAVGGAGLGIVSATNGLNLNPEELVEPPPAEVTVVQDARGREIARFYEEYREVVKLDKVSEVMKTAIVSIEDYR
ncbi:transglycosylase domain-containing protein, partial [Streptosporangium sp. NPDC001682]